MKLKLTESQAAMVAELTHLTYLAENLQQYDKDNDKQFIVDELLGRCTTNAKRVAMQSLIAELYDTEPGPGPERGSAKIPELRILLKDDFATNASRVGCILKWSTEDTLYPVNLRQSEVSYDAAEQMFVITNLIDVPESQDAMLQLVGLTIDDSVLNNTAVFTGESYYVGDMTCKSMPSVAAPINLPAVTHDTIFTTQLSGTFQTYSFTCVAFTDNSVNNALTFDFAIDSVDGEVHTIDVTGMKNESGHFDAPAIAKLYLKAVNNLPENAQTLQIYPGIQHANPIELALPLVEPYEVILRDVIIVHNNNSHIASIQINVMTAANEVSVQSDEPAVETTTPVKKTRARKTAVVESAIAEQPAEQPTEEPAPAEEPENTETA